MSFHFFLSDGHICICISIIKRKNSRNASRHLGTNHYYLKRAISASETLRQEVEAGRDSYREFVTGIALIYIAYFNNRVEIVCGMNSSLGGA